MFKKTLLFVAVAALLTVAGCATGNQPSALFVLDDQVLREDFTRTFDWDNRAEGGVSIGVDDGVYRMRSNTSQYVRGFINQRYTNVVIEVEGVQLSAERNNAYGVICRGSPGAYNASGYYFLIGGDGSYSIRKGRGGEVEPLINWARTDAVNGGTARNVLRVICVEDYLALWVNEQFVAEVRDDAYQGGFMGFAVATEAETRIDIAFDDLTIWEAHLAGD